MNQERYIIIFDSKKITLFEQQLEELNKVKAIRLYNNCFLIEMCKPIAAVNSFIQNELSISNNYTLLMVARGAINEGAPYKMYQYPHVNGVNDTISE